MGLELGTWAPADVPLYLPLNSTGHQQRYLTIYYSFGVLIRRKGIRKHCKLFEKNYLGLIVVSLLYNTILLICVCAW